MSKLSLHQSRVVSRNGLRVQVVPVLFGTELAGLSFCCCIAVGIHACLCKSSLQYHAVRVSAMLEVFGINQHTCHGYYTIFSICKFG